MVGFERQIEAVEDGVERIFMVFGTYASHLFLILLVEMRLVGEHMVFVIDTDCGSPCVVGAGDIYFAVTHPYACHYCGNEHVARTRHAASGVKRPFLYPPESFDAHGIVVFNRQMFRRRECAAAPGGTRQKERHLPVDRAEIIEQTRHIGIAGIVEEMRVGEDIILWSYLPELRGIGGEIHSHGVGHFRDIFSMLFESHGQRWSVAEYDQRTLTGCFRKRYLTGRQQKFADTFHRLDELHAETVARRIRGCCHHNHGF